MAILELYHTDGSVEISYTKEGIYNLCGIDHIVLYTFTLKHNNSEKLLAITD